MQEQISVRHFMERGKNFQTLFENPICGSPRLPLNHAKLRLGGSLALRFRHISLSRRD